MTIASISPAEARRLVAEGARLVDIRNPDEHARDHIPGAVNVPLDRIASLEAADCATVFHCRSGMRTAANADQLARVAGQNCYIIEGGIDGWRQAGLPVETDARQPIALMRQVQLAAGGLVLTGVVLGFMVAPGFFLLAGGVGCGLMFAGATGTCGMASLLRNMPWNRRMAG